MVNRCLILLPILFCCLDVTAAKKPKIDLLARHFVSAKDFDLLNRADLVKNPDVTPNWMNEGRHFWYRRQVEHGYEIVVIESASGRRILTLPADDLTRALDRFGVTQSAQLATSPDKLRLENGEFHVSYVSEDRLYNCTLDPVFCESGIQTPSVGLPSPDGQKTVYLHKHNIWLRQSGSDEDVQLTHDGDLHNSYGSSSDQATLNQPVRFDSIVPPIATHWSPDGRWIVTRQHDERDVLPYPFFETVPKNGGFRPKVHTVRVELLGDKNTARTRYVILDTLTGSVMPITLADGFDFESSATANRPLKWSADKPHAIFYASNINAQVGRVVEVSLVSGNVVRTIIEERVATSRVTLAAETFESSVRILDNEIIWYSERDGWGHLYLYDLQSGELIRQLTYGTGAVYQLLFVDEQRRSLLVSMARDDADADPYLRSIYRVPLDNGDPVLLTPENKHHQVAPEDISPDGNHFIDTYSMVDEPPVTVLRSVRDEKTAIRLETADATDLYAAGWIAPERLKVKAADGKTDLYVALFRPDKDLLAYAPLPVIDQNYINAIASIVPVGFMDAVNSPWKIGTIHLGFFVVMIDGRGTPLRSRAFREAGYPAFSDIQIEDHVAAIRQLAEINPQIDVNRVGIWGSSNGGAGAARAILKRPDFFKVAVASAGSHDYASLPPSGIKYFGVPKYVDGSSVRPEPDAVPENYRPFDNAELAGNLTGHLLLAYGDMDHYALPGTTLRLANALIQAGKDFDLLYMPNHGHFFLFDPYFQQRLRHYFVEHLHGVEPPIAGY